MKKLLIILGIMALLIVVAANMVHGINDLWIKTEPALVSTSQPDEVFDKWSLVKSTGDEDRMFEFTQVSNSICFDWKLGASGDYKDCICKEYNMTTSDCIKEECTTIHYDKPAILPTYDKQGSTVDITKQWMADTYCAVIDDPYNVEWWMKFGNQSIIVEGDGGYNSSDVDVNQDTVTHLNTSSNVMFYMPFDINSTTSEDYSSNNHDGTLVNVTWDANAGYDGAAAYLFDGTDDWIDLTSEPDLSTTDFTVSVWINRDVNPGDFDYLYDWRDGVNDGFVMFVDNGGAVFAKIDAIQTQSSFIHNSTTGWAQVVFTADRDGNSQFYINGVADGASVNISGDQVMAVTSSARIGSEFNGNTFEFEGHMDDYMFFNEALNSTEVLSLYNNQTSRYKSSGNMLFQDIDMTGFTKANLEFDTCDLPSDSSLQVRFNGGTYETVNAQCQSFEIEIPGDETSANMTIQFQPDSNSFYTPYIQGDIELWGYNAYYNTTSTDNITEEENYAHLSTLSDFKLYLPFDIDSSPTRDYTLNHFDGTATNGATYNASCDRDGTGCWEFDGTNDCLVIADEDGQDFYSTDDFSLSAWFKTNDVGIQHVLAKYTSDSSYRLVVNAGKAEFVIEGNGSAALPTVNSALTYNDSAWHHMVGVRDVDNDLLLLYVDGSYVANVTDTTVGDIFPAAAIWVGSVNAACTTQPFEGQIDEVAIIDYDLTPSEVSDLYNSQYARFYPGGDMIFDIDVGATNTSMNVTLDDCLLQNDTYFRGRVNNLAYQNFNGCNLTNYDISSVNGSNNLTINFQSSSNQFFSPILIENISLSFAVAAAPVNDTTDPTVTLLYPTDNLVLISQPIDLNFTATDDIAVDSCWYSLNGGADVALPGCANTTFSPGAGVHNIRVYANDTSGNTGQSALNNFTLDLAAPTVTIVSPANATTITIVPFDLRYNAVDDGTVDSCWYNLNGGANVTLASCANTTLNQVNGNYNLTVYANDTAGRLGSSLSSYTVDYTPPTNITGTVTALDKGAAGLAIVVFILFATAGIFALPFIIKNFAKSEMVDMILKRISLMIGIFLMTVNAAIVATIAESTELPLTNEMFMYMTIFSWAGFALIFYIVFKTFLDSIFLWKENKRKKRMGELDA